MSGNGDLGGAGSGGGFAGGPAAADGVLGQWVRSSRAFKALVLLVWINPAIVVLVAGHGVSDIIAVLLAFACGFVPAGYLFATAPPPTVRISRPDATLLATKTGACLLSAMAIGTAIQRDLFTAVGLLLLVCAAVCAAGTFAINRGHPAAVWLLFLACFRVLLMCMDAAYINHEVAIRVWIGALTACLVALGIWALRSQPAPSSQSTSGTQPSSTQSEPQDARPEPIQDARPQPLSTAATQRRARSARVFLGVLLADVVILVGGFVAAVAIGFQSWNASPDVAQSVAGKQEGQFLTAGAFVCLALAVVALIAWQKRAKSAVALQCLIILVVIGIAGTGAASYHHDQQRSGLTQHQQQPAPNTNQGSYCSGGQCWGPNNGG